MLNKTHCKYTFDEFLQIWTGCDHCHVHSHCSKNFLCAPLQSVLLPFLSACLRGLGLKTICSADFPDSLGLCRNYLSFFWSCVPFLGEHVPHGERSCLTPLLGPGLPEDRNPGPTTLHNSLRSGGAHCSPAR